MVDESAARFRSGLGFGLVAYLWWGLVPVYFAALARSQVPAGEILAHRIVWSLPIMAALVGLAAGWRDVLRVLRSRRLVLTLLASASLLAANWLIYIYATVTGRVTEASLGYYMLPLVNIAFATLILKEKLRPIHYPALALIATGVAIPCVAVGYLPWIAVALPITFGLYGLVRKKVAVESMTGLTVETLLLLPPSLGFLLYLSADGRNHMTADDWRLNALIVFSGVVTVVPLLTYTLSLRRLPLLAVSFIQFLSPTVQVLIAVLFLGERDKLTPETVAAFACVWAAVALFIVDSVWQARQFRRGFLPGTAGVPHSGLTAASPAASGALRPAGPPGAADRGPTASGGTATDGPAAPEAVSLDATPPRDTTGIAAGGTPAVPGKATTPRFGGLPSAAPRR